MATRLAVEPAITPVETPSISESREESSVDDHHLEDALSSPRASDGPPRYMTSIKNGGVGYIDLSTIDREPMAASVVNEDLRDLFDDLVNEAANADFRSGIYKFLYRATEISILAMTTVAGFLGIFDPSNKGFSYAIGALCFTAAGLKSGLEMTGMYKRAITIRGVASDLRALSREARNLLYKQGDAKDRIKEYDQLCAKMDELLMTAFSSDLTTYSSPQARGSSNERFSRVSGRAENPLPIDAVY